MYHTYPVLNREYGNYYHFSLQNDKPTLQILRIGYEMRMPSFDNRFETPKDWVIGYIVSGKGELYQQKNKLPLLQNNIFIRALDGPFRFKNTGNEPIQICVVAFHDNGFSIPKDLQFSQIIQSINNSNFRDLIDTILKLLASLPHATESFANSFNNSILEWICSLIQTEDRKPLVGFARFEACLTTMNSHIESDWEIAEICSACQISRAQLCRLFKKFLNQSPSAYWKDLKIQRAGFLLKNTTLSSKEIAYQVGFRDPLYFSKIFKIKIGLNPRQYRTKNI